MIPISGDSKFVYVDEKSGAEYYFRYLLESDRQARYSLVCKKESEKITALENQAKQFFAVETSQEEIRLKAYEMLNELREKNPADRIEEMDEYINIFLVGWNGKNFLEFPKDGQPAKCFMYFQKIKVYRIIMDKIQELTGFSEDEIKN